MVGHYFRNLSFNNAIRGGPLKITGRNFSVWFFSSQSYVTWKFCIVFTKDMQRFADALITVHLKISVSCESNYFPLDTNRVLRVLTKYFNELLKDHISVTSCFVMLIFIILYSWVIILICIVFLMDQSSWSLLDRLNRTFAVARRFHHLSSATL